MQTLSNRWVEVGTDGAGNRIFVRNLASGDYEGMTKAELQEALEAKGLPKTGNKDELIARLQGEE